MITYKITIQ